MAGFDFSSFLGGVGGFLKNNAGSLLNAGLNLYGARQADKAVTGAVTGAAQNLGRYAPQQIFSPFGNVVSSGGTTRFEAPTDPYGILPPELRESAEAQASYLGGQGDVYGQLGAGFLGALGSFDPQAAAQERYGQLTSLAEPQERRDFFNLENRLFQQGRLGTTGGSQNLADLAQARDRADTERRLASFDFAGREQSRLADLGLGFGGAGAQALAGRTGLARDLLQTSQSLFQPLGQLGNLALGFGAPSTAAGQATQAIGESTQNRYDAYGRALEPIIGGVTGKIGDIFAGLGGVSEIPTSSLPKRIPTPVPFGAAT